MHSIPIQCDTSFDFRRTSLFFHPDAFFAFQIIKFQPGRSTFGNSTKEETASLRRCQIGVPPWKDTLQGKLSVVFILTVLSDWQTNLFPTKSSRSIVLNDHRASPRLWSLSNCCCHGTPVALTDNSNIIINAYRPCWVVRPSRRLRHWCFPKTELYRKLYVLAPPYWIIAKRGRATERYSALQSNIFNSNWNAFEAAWNGLAAFLYFVRNCGMKNMYKYFESCDCTCAKRGVTNGDLYVRLQAVHRITSSHSEVYCDETIRSEARSVHLWMNSLVNHIHPHALVPFQMVTVGRCPYVTFVF